MYVRILLTAVKQVPQRLEVELHSMLGKFVIWKMLKSLAFLLVEFMLWLVMMVMTRHRMRFVQQFNKFIFPNNMLTG